MQTQVGTGRVLKSKAYLRRSLEAKERAKLDEEADALLKKLSDGTAETIPFVPPELQTIIETPKTIYFYGSPEPRVKSTTIRKTYKRFGRS